MSEETAIRTRQPLNERENLRLYYDDVVRAIFRLVNERDPQLYPMAFTRRQILLELVDEALGGNNSFPAQKLLLRQFELIFDETPVLNRGYKQYERIMGYPVCPVTSYFFEEIHVGAEDFFREFMMSPDGMTQSDISHSLPRGRSGVVVRFEDGQTFEVDRNVAGIVLFNQNQGDSPLLQQWHAFITKIDMGVTGSVGRRLGYSLPVDHRAREILERYRLGEGRLVENAHGMFNVSRGGGELTGQDETIIWPKLPAPNVDKKH